MESWGETDHYNVQLSCSALALNEKCKQAIIDAKMRFPNH